MPVSDQDRKIVENVFKAMHDREKGEQAMMALFAQDATVTEPFSGEPRTHSGHSAIRAWFKEAVQNMPPDMRIKLDRLDLDGGRVRADWTCTSAAFGGPMRGIDYYAIESGKIKTAEYIVTDMPEMK